MLQSSSIDTAADVLSHRNWAAESDGGGVSAVACLPAGLVLLECVPGGGDDFKYFSPARRLTLDGISLKLHWI